MAITEKMGVMTQVDENGNETILYPKTKAELVDGLEEKINEQLGGVGTGGGGANEATINTKIAGHNTANDSHQDIRLMIKEHEEAVNALLNSDDKTLDETKEIVAYIKSNKDLIDAITDSKVNVTDIINNLTTNVTNKPLSAAQGVAIKSLIDSKIGTEDLAEEVQEQINAAKENGELGGRGPGVLKVSTTPTSWTQAIGGKNPIKKMSIATIKKEAYVDEVIIGDNIQHSSYLYRIYYLDNTYAYMDTSQNLKGSNGSAGKSAYAYAKDGGYGGTEAEYASDVNPTNIANVAANNAKEYITDDLKSDIVSDLISELKGLPVFGIVDENNVVTVTSMLANGTYTLKYENEDGSFDVIGTIIVGTGTGGGSGGDEPVVIINLLETAKGEDGAVFNGVGYIDGKYLTGSNSVSPIYVAEETGAAHFVTGYIPYTLAQAQAHTPIYVRGASIDTSNSHERIGFYPSLDYAEWLDPLKLNVDSITVTRLANDYFSIVPPPDPITSGGYGFTDINFIRLSLSGSGAGVIITVNQEIPD